MLRPGDIVLIDFPYTNHQGSKVRPGLVTSSDESKFSDVNIAYITSEIDSYYFDDTAVLISRKDIKEGGLKKESIVRIDKIITVNSKVCRKVATLNSDKIRQILRQLIRYNVCNFSHEKFKENQFISGTTNIPPAGKVIDEHELSSMVDASLDGWLTTGRFNEQFEQKLSNFLDLKYVLTTNSGSSANLLAFTALTSERLGERQILPGDEVISVAAAFPTTVNPIIQNNCIPVFLDVDLQTYNINIEQLEDAISDKTKAIMLAHTLGNPFNLTLIKAIAEKYNLWLIEDCCDALGSKYDNKMVGTFGDIATFSFYPAHHITMGEGGALATNNHKLKIIIESFRDWGRDCYCKPGHDNTCLKRFSWQKGELPEGYDHKYIYSHIGYNLKITDMQAACGLAQMDKLHSFIQSRKENFNYLSKKLQDLEPYLYLPKATENSEPAWFGFPITLKSSEQYHRVDLLKFLDQYKIGSRLLFSGNIIRQPYFVKQNYKVIGNLKNTDTIMEKTFWIGIYPGITREMLDYVIKQLFIFFNQNN